MEPLAGGAMAVLCIQRHCSAQLVLDAAAVAAASPLGLEFFILAVNPVGFLVLPFVVITYACLEAVAGVCVDILGRYSVTLPVFLGSHVWRMGVDAREWGSCQEWKFGCKGSYGGRKGAAGRGKES